MCIVNRGAPAGDPASLAGRTHGRLPGNHAPFRDTCGPQGFDPDSGSVQGAGPRIRGLYRISRRAPANSRAYDGVETAIVWTALPVFGACTMRPLPA